MTRRPPVSPLPPGHRIGDGDRAWLVPPDAVDVRLTVGAAAGRGSVPLRRRRHLAGHPHRRRTGHAADRAPRRPRRADRGLGRGGRAPTGLLAQVPDLLGLRRRPPPGFAPVHPLVPRAAPPPPAACASVAPASMVEALLPTIVAQKVPAADALRSWRGVRRWLRRAGPRAGRPHPAARPGPPGRARLPRPPPLRHRAEAGRAVPGRLPPGRAASSGSSTARPSSSRPGCSQIRGVGPWTATSVARSRRSATPTPWSWATTASRRSWRGPWPASARPTTPACSSCSSPSDPTGPGPSPCWPCRRPHPAAPRPPPALGAIVAPPAAAPGR